MKILLVYILWSKNLSIDSLLLFKHGTFLLDWSLDVNSILLSLLITFYYLQCLKFTKYVYLHHIWSLPQLCCLPGFRHATLKKKITFTVLSWIVLKKLKNESSKMSRSPYHILFSPHVLQYKYHHTKICSYNWYNDFTYKIIVGKEICANDRVRAFFGITFSKPPKLVHRLWCPSIWWPKALKRLKFPDIGGVGEKQDHWSFLRLSQ